jgi:hypothetical protein
MDTQRKARFWALAPKMRPNLKNLHNITLVFLLFGSLDKNLVLSKMGLRCEVMWRSDFWIAVLGRLIC